MSRFKGAPVFDVDAIVIDEKRLAQIKSENTPTPARVKYKSGTRFHTLTYPGYEGLDVYFGISDLRRGQEGLVRITGWLPPKAARPEQILSTCPHCKKRFPEGMLVIPAEGKVYEIEVDETHTETEWEKLIVEWGLRIVDAG